MFTIKKNANWEKMEKLFDQEILDRYNWFLFEFGKKLTGIVLEDLLGRLKDVKGTKDYQKRLAIAEIRDQSHRVWWAIAAKMKTLGQSEYDAKSSLLEVIPRFKIADDDPISEILVNFGPWTAETLPFMPSLRQAVVKVKKSTTQKVLAVRKQNITEGKAIVSFMKKHGIEVEPRINIYQRLRVFPDLEMEALRIEFGMAEYSKSHWRPAIAFAKRGALEILKKDTDLIRALTDPNFKGYSSMKHAPDKMSLPELKALEAFQKKIRDTSK